MKIRKDGMSMDTLLLILYVMICIAVIILGLMLIITISVGFWVLLQLLLSDLKDIRKD